jgi:shikimate dehydrogenase
MEKDFIQSDHPKSGCLISCGGGLPIAEGMIEILKDNGKVFTLWASPKTIFERIKKNSSRPLLQTEDPFSKITELLSEREVKYRKADKIISTDVRSVSEVAALIQKNYLDELN